MNVRTRNSAAEQAKCDKIHNPNEQLDDGALLSHFISCAALTSSRLWEKFPASLRTSLLIMRVHFRTFPSAPEVFSSLRFDSRAAARRDELLVARRVATCVTSGNRVANHARGPAFADWYQLDCARNMSSTLLHKPHKQSRGTLLIRSWRKVRRPKKHTKQ